MKTIEGTATELMSQMGPMAERARDQMGPMAEKARHQADELIERMGEEGRHLSERMGERLSAQLAELPDATLKRVNLVPARKARRKMIWGLLVGMLVGAIAVRMFSGEEGERRRREIRSRMGWEEPQSAVAVTGDLPQ